MSRVAPTLSGVLGDHINELPLVRRAILSVIQEFSATFSPSARVLDAGAGNAPYAELFRHCEYVTVDWQNSVHEGAVNSDIVAALDELPVADAAFDGVLCTEVLEHVRHPEAVLGELQRILVPGGRLCLTVPFVWPLHEEPFDFCRYTPYALLAMLEASGFDNIVITPTTGYLSTLGQVAQMSGWLFQNPSAPRLTRKQRTAFRALRMLSIPLVWLASRNCGLDETLIGVSLPLGFRALASKARISET